MRIHLSHPSMPQPIWHKLKYVVSAFLEVCLFHFQETNQPSWSHKHPTWANISEDKVGHHPGHVWKDKSQKKIAEMATNRTQNISRKRWWWRHFFQLDMHCWSMLKLVLWLLRWLRLITAPQLPEQVVLDSTVKTRWPNVRIFAAHRILQSPTQLQKTLSVGNKSHLDFWYLQNILLEVYIPTRTNFISSSHWHSGLQTMNRKLFVEETISPPRPGEWPMNRQKKNGNMLGNKARVFETCMAWTTFLFG